MKKTLSIVIAIAMIAAMLLPMSIFASAEVTEITNWQDFALLVTDSLGEGNYKLTADVYCDQPIEGFFGTFDGNGHTVYLSATMFMDVGAGAVIKNFTTEQDPNAAATDAEGNPVEFKMYRSPVIDLASGSTEDLPIIVENITNNVDTYSTTSFNQDPIGGIIGRTTGDNAIVMNNLVNNGDLCADDQTGGIIGNACHNSDTESLIIRAANIVNNGKVSAVKKSGYGGGIIGNVNGSIKGTLDYCFNFGDVSAAHDAGGIIGDINGISELTISNCAVKGTLVNNPDKFTGADKTSAKYGSAGIIARSNAEATVINIENCVIATTLKADASEDGSAKASTDPFNVYSNGGLITAKDCVYLHGMAVYGEQAFTTKTTSGFTTNDQVAINAKIDEMLAAKNNAVADTFVPPVSDTPADETTVPAGDETTVPAGNETTAKPAGDNTTAKPADTNKPATTTAAPAEKSGCGSSISLAIVAVAAVGAVAIARKKEN